MMIFFDIDQTLIDQRKAEAAACRIAGCAAEQSIYVGDRLCAGELMIEVQARVLALMEILSRRHPAMTVALVSHADVIRGALAHCLGMPLDLVLRLEVSPASISIVAMQEYGPRVLCINNTEEISD